MLNARKAFLLAIPREYEGYRLHLSVDPVCWPYPVETFSHSLACARAVKARAEIELLGIEVVISKSPNHYPIDGPDHRVMENIEIWLEGVDSTLMSDAVSKVFQNI